MRARNFSRRLVFFLAANSAWANVVWCVMSDKVEAAPLAVSKNPKTEGLNQRFLRQVHQCPISVGWQFGCALASFLER